MHFSTSLALQSDVHLTFLHYYKYFSIFNGVVSYNLVWFRILHMSILGGDLATPLTQRRASPPQLLI